MNRLLSFAVFLCIALISSCNTNYNPTQDSPHVDSLNRERLRDMLSNMISHIKSYNFTHDPDIDFVALVKIHHTTAIDMAKREKDWGKDTSLIRFADRMINTENDEIDFFDKYEHVHKPTKINQSFFTEAQSALFKEQVPQQQGNIDTVFSSLIIKHHQLAISLCDIYLKYATDPALKSIAKENIHHHRENIAELENIRKK